MTGSCFGSKHGKNARPCSDIDDHFSLEKSSVLGNGFPVPFGSDFVSEHGVVDAKPAVRAVVAVFSCLRHVVVRSCSFLLVILVQVVPLSQALSELHFIESLRVHSVEVLFLFFLLISLGSFHHLVFIVRFFRLALSIEQVLGRSWRLTFQQLLLEDN